MDHEDETKTGIKQRRLLFVFRMHVVCAVQCSVQQALIEWRLSLLLQRCLFLVNVRVMLQREDVLVDSA